VAFGSFTFDPDDADSVLVVPEVVVHRRAGAMWAVSEAAPALRDVAESIEAHDFRLRYAGSSMPETGWLEAVALAVKEIEATELDKVVLARDIKVWSKEPFDVKVLLARLAQRFPECYTFSCAGLVGATPELLVGRYGDSASSLVLAGSARRGASHEEDDAIGARLLASAKDVSEHTPSVASVTEALGPVCKNLDVGAPHLLKLANVQHIATRITGHLAKPLSALQLAGRLHPSAAICGAPTLVALGAIRRLEGMKRSRYAGPVGWVDANGDGEFGIALRCMEVEGAAGRLFAGGGIVAASEPEAELEETRLKFRAVLAALEGAAH
jgi:menaquinone-specific isochorismate synthase